MSGVPTGRECSGTSRGSSAHAGISEMEHSAVRPCRENENILKMEVNYRYIPIYSTITMDSNNPKTLAPTPSQCTPYSQYFQSSEVFPNIPDPRYAKTATPATVCGVTQTVKHVLLEVENKRKNLLKLECANKHVKKLL